jgi:Tfp pilus assembly pilus retraction ATPase PilT
VKQIDRLLSKLDRYQATGVVLASDAPIRLRVVSGDRATNQIPTHAELVAMMSEILRDATLERIRAGNAVEVTHDFDGRTFAVTVTPGPGGWHVVVELAIGHAPTAQASESARAPIDAMLHDMLARGATDLHLSAGMVPRVRIDGKHEDLGAGYPVMTATSLLALVTPIVPEENQAQYRQRHTTDFMYVIPGVSRFRCTLFHDQRGPAVAIQGEPLAGA